MPATGESDLRHRLRLAALDHFLLAKPTTEEPEYFVAEWERIRLRLTEKTWADHGHPELKGDRVTATLRGRHTKPTLTSIASDIWTLHQHYEGYLQRSGIPGEDAETEPSENEKLDNP